jgi:hypothetical protein
MSRRRLVAVVLSLSALSVAAVYLSAQEQPTAPGPDAGANSSAARRDIGKVVFVDGPAFAVLENVSTAQIGPRAFLVGTYVGNNNVTKSDFTGKTVWLPIDKVNRLVVFDSLEDIDDAMTQTNRNADRWTYAKKEVELDVRDGWRPSGGWGAGGERRYANNAAINVGKEHTKSIVNDTKSLHHPSAPRPHLPPTGAGSGAG